ncbi:sigma-70 family RNA polymerase sigma factor [Lentibacillus salinarum]|uniref:Sigma-70 family RNA polymerase sigma factor n=1 Tax=Lentibacillus salinarum TaxID=446820 RepID=A0ABW3ZVP2_9BACI
MEKKRVNDTFEDIFNQNKRRIHYHLHQLQMSDPHQVYYQEGLVAMWNAYRKYEPDKGPMATYFNYMIRNRLIDLIRKETGEKEKQTMILQKRRLEQEDGNYYRSGSTANRHSMAQAAEDMGMYRTDVWAEVKGNLSEKQWKWVTYFIIEDMSVQEIAEQEGVSVETVKGWGKAARRKLRGVVAEEKLEFN